MSIFKTNTKLKEASVATVNFSLPSITTCPFADKCKKYCYAEKGNFKRFPAVKAAHHKNLELTKTAEFAETAVKELERKVARGLKAVRIHDSGDFYNEHYAMTWIRIANALPELKFYAYTKSVKYFKDVASIIPQNLIIVFSYGGKQDDLINDSEDRHAKIFPTKEALCAEGYVDASKNDSLAWSALSNKIGLVAH